jgi:hypothetical protein
VKLDHAIELVQDAEASLADDLRTLGERHAAEADVYHVAHLLAGRCTEQLERLLPHAQRYSAPERTDAGHSTGALERVRRLSSELLAGRPEPAMLLLHDLRETYVSAHGAEIAWVILRQAAKAARDADLVTTSEQGLEEAERRWKWLRTKLKNASPQILVAG